VKDPKPLWMLARDADDATFRERLDAMGLPPDRGGEALRMAAAWNRTSVIDMLADKGAYLDAADARGSTALHSATHAAKGQSGMERFAALERLLERGADVNARNSRGGTALMTAAWSADAALTRLLIDRGADVDLADSDGKTALIMACQRDFNDFCDSYDNRRPSTDAWLAVVSTLVVAGANREHRDSTDRSALDYAEGNSDLLELLRAP
jgi:ankyrin repeat protein